MKLIDWIILLFFSVILSGCGGKNVLFFENVGQPSPPNVTRLYVDAFGNLYPNSGLSQVYQPVDGHQGSLFAAMADSSSKLCPAESQPSEASVLCDAILMEGWHPSQYSLWEKSAKTIAEQAQIGSGEVDLIFLIHGYNNLESAAKKSYKKARKDIARYQSPGRRQYFIEVYWDGYTSDTGLGVWAKAQSSGPLVGFKLRRLIYAIKRDIGDNEADVRLRFLTHSSGAFVVGALFGDPIAALPLLKKEKALMKKGKDANDEDYRFFFENRNKVDVKDYNSITSFRDLRIGMLAPATPSDTFAGSKKYKGGLLSTGATVLLSIHPKDEALTKYFLGADFFNSGSTGLGAKTNHYCPDLKSNPDLERQGIRFVAYDFARNKDDFPDTVKSHKFVDYLDQATGHSTFMADLFSSDIPNQDITENGICDGYK